MKNSFMILILISLLNLGCSAKKTNQDETNVDLTELDESPIEEVEGGAVVALDTEMMAESEPEQEELVVEEDSSYSPVVDAEQSPIEEDNFVASSELASDAPAAYQNGETSEYIVQSNDTLMLVAWKIYGDYSKWRELKDLNQEKLHGKHLWIGDKLSFNRPEVEFVWSPEGSPYLIKSGDTLGLVSQNVYQDKKHWKSIWYNNRDLIRDPNLIFAGFTIFYKELDQINEREVASKMRLFKK